MGNQINKQDFSRLRQALVQLSYEVRVLLKPFLSDQPLIKGTVYELKRKCGKPGCKCSRGDLHHSMVVSSSEQGKTKLRAIPRGFLVEVRKKVVRYQKARRARTRMVEVHKQMLEIMDKMERMRREEVPSASKKSPGPDES